jgi:prepilin-type N-terminal cleavage/methylation domain-containing protein
MRETNQPIRLSGLKPGVCSGLILSGAFYTDLKIGVWRRRTYQKGVTLIELIIVFVIIAIGATLLVPGISAWLPNYRLRSATRDVVSALRTAQMKAVSTNTVYGVAFDVNACQLYRSSGGLQPEGGSINLPSGVQFNNITFPINTTLNKRFAQFNPDSTSSIGGVTLQNTKGSQRRITVTAATGRVNIN